MSNPPDAHLEKLMVELELATIDAQTWPSQSRPNVRLRAARQSLRDFLSERTLTEDTELLDALDCFCRAIAIRSFGGTRTDKVFRWQVEVVGPADLRPTVRDAIRSAISATEPRGLVK